MSRCKCGAVSDTHIVNKITHRKFRVVKRDETGMDIIVYLPDVEVDLDYGRMAAMIQTHVDLGGTVDAKLIEVLIQDEVLVP